MTKQKFKNIIGSWYSIFDYPILVNSYGRSGSTVLTKSIIKCAISPKNEVLRDIAYRSISQDAWDLEKVKLQNGILYKTHDYPPKHDVKNNVRMLYTFADPVDVILSLLRLYDERGEEWIKEHYDHLKAPYSKFQDIVSKDQLRLERHLDAWLNEDRFPVAFIKYESMWDHQDEISDFLGFPIALPPFKKRKAQKESDIEIMRTLTNTYTSLSNKIKNLDNFFIKNGTC